MESWNYGASRPTPDPDDDIDVLADSRIRSPMRLLYGRLPSPPSIPASRPPRERSPLPSYPFKSLPSYSGASQPSKSSRQYTPSPPKESFNIRASNYSPPINPFAATSYAWEEPRKDYYSGRYSPKPREVSPLPLSSYTPRKDLLSLSPIPVSPSRAFVNPARDRLSPSDGRRRISPTRGIPTSQMPLPRTAENKGYPSRPINSRSPSSERRKLSPSPPTASTKRSRSPLWNSSGDKRYDKIFF